MTIIVQFLRELERKTRPEILLEEMEKLRQRFPTFPRAIQTIYLKSLLANGKLKEAEVYFDSLPLKTKVCECLRTPILSSTYFIV
jgi:hypothetical protein